MNGIMAQELMELANFVLNCKRVYTARDGVRVVGGAQRINDTDRLFFSESSQVAHSSRI